MIDQENHFKYYGTINYKFANDNGLNLHAAALFGYMYDVFGKPWMVCDSEGYCWLQKSKIQKECPILDFKADTIGRYLKKLADLGLILRKTVDGKKSYYKLTNKAQEWDHEYIKTTTDSDPTSDFERNRVRIQKHSSTDGDPTYNNYHYNTNQENKNETQKNHSSKTEKQKPIQPNPNILGGNKSDQLATEVTQLDNFRSTQWIESGGGSCSRATVKSHWQKIKTSHPNVTPDELITRIRALIKGGQYNNFKAEAFGNALHDAATAISVAKSKPESSGPPKMCATSGCNSNPSSSGLCAECEYRAAQ